MTNSRMSNPSDSSPLDHIADDGVKQAPENGPHDASGRSEAAQEPQAGAGNRDSSYPREIGGPKGPEPTRYGDWEKNGRCIDF